MQFLLKSRDIIYMLTYFDIHKLISCEWNYFPNINLWQRFTSIITFVDDSCCEE